MAVMFPGVGFQVLSSLIYFLGLSVLAHCLSRRIQTSWTTHWPRLVVLLIFLDSWLFVFSSGVLIFGVGLETTLQACTGAISICIAFYASSKVLIYLFLSEKVLVIWSTTSEVGGRFRSPVYLICLGTMMGYVVVLGLMIHGAIHYWREDGTCVIGLKAFSSIPLLAYDLYITIFLNALFLWPLCRSGIPNPRIRKVTIRTLVASLAALLTSSVNIGVLTIQHGRQLGWVCLGCCGTDVVLNAIAIFWVTDHASESIRTIPSVSDDTIRISEPQNLGRRHGPSIILGPGVKHGVRTPSQRVVDKESDGGGKQSSRKGHDLHPLQVIVTTHTSTQGDQNTRARDSYLDMKDST